MPQWEVGSPLSFQSFGYTSYKTTEFIAKSDNVIHKLNTNEITVHYPHMDTSHKCTKMLLFNLAEPDWISVPCNKSLLSHNLCYLKIPNYALNSKTQNVTDYSYCLRNHIMLQKKCYIFIWLNSFNTSNLCANFEALPGKKTIIKYLKDLFGSISVINEYPPIIIDNYGNTVHVIKFKHFFNKLNYIHTQVAKYKVSGYLVCSYKKHGISSWANLFHCTKGGYILSENLCDSVIDCPNDRSDEEFCYCQNNSANRTSSNFCKILYFGMKKKVCSNLYYMTVQGTCLKYKSLSHIMFSNSHLSKMNLYGREPESITTKKFICKDGKSIDITYLNDLIFDCGLDGNDEPVLMSLLKYDNYSSCTEPNMIPCMGGHSTCYYLKDICIYKTNKYNNLIPCRTGGHLQNCRNFECSLMFKCVHSYCIPWSYVCDGKWDCPEGNDEMNNPVCINNKACIYLYKCRNTQQRCLHLENLCDGNEDCPFGDDETLCDLKQANCPSECSCLLLAIKCRYFSTLRIARDMQSHFLYVEISNYIDFSLPTFHKSLPNVTIVKLSRNCLVQICFLTSRNLLLFDLGFNCLKIIFRNCFTSLWLLRALHLNDNYIGSVEPGSFYNLSNLRYLNLSNNPLINLPENVFKTLSKLKLFYAVNVSLTDIHIKSLHDSDVKLVITSDYHLCCIAASKTLCQAHKPWYISCSDILPEDKMKVLYISVSNLTIWLNIMSILIHYLTKKSNNAYVGTIISVNVNEILCGIYLAFIWVSDINLKGKFLIKEELWRSGLLCFSAFGLLLWFTILSQLILIFLSLSRLMIVIHPMDTMFKRTESVFKSVLLLCVFSLLVAVSTTLHFKITYGVLPISLCLPFIDPTNSVLLIKIITWVTVITQTVSSVIIMVLHIILVQKVKQSKNFFTKSESDTDHNTLLVVQLIVITVSNIISWFPANVIYIAAMFLSNYPIDLITWTTITVLPINSILNPSVFIITALRTFLKSKK